MAGGAGFIGSCFARDVLGCRDGTRITVVVPTFNEAANREAFLRDVYEHRMPVPAAGFREFAGSDSFLAPLARRLRDLDSRYPEVALHWKPSDGQ